MAVAIDDNTFLTPVDDLRDRSVATDPCCPVEGWGRDCSEPCAPRSGCEDTLISSCSTTCGAYLSVALPSLGLASVPKMRWADLADDMTTNASPRSTQSLCDEPCDELGEPENQDRRQRWADMEDSDPGETDEARLDKNAVTTDSHPDHGEVFSAPEESQKIRPSRASRRARRAGVQQSQAVDEDRSTSVFFTAPKGKAKAAPGSEEQHSKGASKGVSKGVAKGAVKGKGNDTSKGVGKGASTCNKKSTDAASKGAGKGANGEKFQCQLIVGIEEDSKFRVVRRIIGQGGENMKQIAELSGAKLRLRGRGSKFLEGPEQKESDDDLMLCISTQDKDGFDKAKKAASDLIEGIYNSYRSFCRKSGKTCSELKLKVHEGYRAGSR